jgi:hypothetical protein
VSTLNALMIALEQVVSGGDPMKTEADGQRAGVLLLSVGFVDEVNRILDGEWFGPQSRFSKEISESMLAAWFAHYVTSQRLGRDPTMRDYAVAFHGGPMAPLNPSDSDLAFWDQVEHALRMLGD